MKVSCNQMMLDEHRMPSPSFHDGAACQDVLDAIERSVREERWVPVAPY